MNFRTDLALEAVKALGYDKIKGITQQEKKTGSLKLIKMSVKTDEAAKKIGKLKGEYITIELPEFTDNAKDINEKVEVISKQIRYLLPQNGLIFVVGLGNESITPDALGPRTIKSILATRHITKEIARSTGLEALRGVAAIAPGVLGQTGIEVSEIIKSIIKKIDPVGLIVVDALASMQTSRLGTTVQICNTGISPGSGVGNARPGINEKTMGVPVIGIGVPTVVDAQTMAKDILDLSENSRKEKLEDKTMPRGEPMIVTPREIDLLIERASKLLAMSINSALQPEFSIEEIMSLV